MATNQETADDLVQQLQGSCPVTTKKMFGEYAVYHEGVVVALLCDNQLFVKKTAPGLSFVQDPTGIPAYPNARNYLRVPRDRWIDVAWLSSFIKSTAEALRKTRVPKVETRSGGSS
ncbi:MAG TPA: TfoX/Sxy family protein [Thermomicrobiales bacterium]|nr:TfoX/Sxy family protein [Thermomicrobiales bacterium]